MKRGPPSLRARALAWLAQREQSRSELRRKLMRLVQQRREQAEAAAQAAEAQSIRQHPTDPADPAEEVEQLLDSLDSQGLLSDERFVESRVRVRAAGMGARRIEMELAQHGLKLGAQPLQQLRDSEFDRARQLWRRRFTAVPVDARERARQMRFLAGRGFSGEVIRRVLASAGDPEIDEPA